MRLDDSTILAGWLRGGRRAQPDAALALGVRGCIEASVSDLAHELKQSERACSGI